MLVRNMAYYEARIIFGMASLLPLVLLPAYLITGWALWSSRQSFPTLQQITQAVELILTLSSGLTSAHLMTIEREEGFDEIRRSYSERSWRVPMLRTIEACLLVMLSMFFSALVVYLMYGAYDLRHVFLYALPPALYLCGLAMLVNNLTGNYWISGGLVIAYWYGEFVSSGAYSGVFFLFNHAMPRADVNSDVNRGVLLVLALLCFTLNIALSMWRRRCGSG